MTTDENTIFLPEVPQDIRSAVFHKYLDSLLEKDVNIKDLSLAFTCLSIAMQTGKTLMDVVTKLDHDSRQEAASMLADAFDAEDVTVVDWPCG